MTPLFAMFGLGGGEIVLILAVVLLLFGAKKLPELARGLGQGIKEFKKASNEVTGELQRSMDDNEPPAPRTKLPPEGSEAQPSHDDHVKQQPPH